MTTAHSSFPSFVLTLHSHIIRGYMGNQVIVFPLQLLGRYVDQINTCQFTALYCLSGKSLESAEADKLLETIPSTFLQRDPYGDLSKVDYLPLLRYRFLMTGFIGSAANLRCFLTFMRNVRSHRQKRLNTLTEMIESGLPLYVCDPVLGDDGKIYVKEELLEVYRDEAVPLADIILPNQSELEWLCGRKMGSLQEASIGCKELHERGPAVVVVTSVLIPENDLLLLASERTPEGNRQFCLQIPRLDVSLVGTGDLFSAMFIHELDSSKGQLEVACQKAARVLHVRIGLPILCILSCCFIGSYQKDDIYGKNTRRTQYH